MDVDEVPPDGNEMPPPPPPNLDQAAAGEHADLSASDESDTTIPMTGSDAELINRGTRLTDVPPSEGQNTRAWGNQRDHDEDDEDEDASDEEEPQPKTWQPYPEDKSTPCEDELKFIISKGEHSAMDHEYWEKKTFLGLDDPEMVAGESGRIDWLVEGFNGTKEKPNNELIMRSPVVRIGGLDWQIKLYPKGDNSYCPSAYVECVSMKEDTWASTEPFEHPPFPWLKGIGQERQRRSVAAQLSIVMYNPAEPRVYKYRVDAHQFHKKKNDYGWKYFLDHHQPHIYLRNHAQRQAMLRNDRLAFKAYIRIVEDPTRNQWQHWQHGNHHADLPLDVISTTGLRPFRKSMQYICGIVPLLHFAPFRRLVQELPPGKQSSNWLQPLLLRMFTRQLSLSYGNHVTAREGDVMEMLSKVSHLFHSENDAELVRQWEELVGNFHAGIGAACGVNRLNTKDYTSIQDAVNNHPKRIMRPQLLTLELTRQEHDKKTRRWNKLTNQVHVDEHIKIEGTSYTLFAFVTHSGSLTAYSAYKSYVRPRGRGQGWYCYSDGFVRRLTEKQARDRHSGTSSKNGRLGESDLNSHSSEASFYQEHVQEEHGEDEVPSIVMYVREDVAAETFEAPAVEAWVPPCMRGEYDLAWLHKMHCDDQTQTQKHENTLSIEDLEKLDPEDRFRADLARLTRTFVHETNASTPEPGRMDGEDTIMQDVDEEFIFMHELPEMDIADDPPLEKGTFSWLGRCHYEGQWKNGKYHGGGHHIDVNGDEYLGTFKSGYKYGYGKMIYANTGDVYEGEWENGQRHGTGRYTELSSGNVYEGGWMDDRRHGSFVLRGTFPEEEKSLCTICYDKDLSTAFIPCGHVVACEICSKRLHECPLCRRPVQARQELYGVKFSLG